MSNITEITSGLRFPEGPIAMPDGSIILVEIERQTLSRVSPTGEALRTAYITLSESGRLVSLPWPRPGLALNYLQAQAG